MTAVLDVTTAKRALKAHYDAGDDEDELAIYVQAVCELVDELCGPSAPTAYSQTFAAPTSRSGAWYLDHAPVLSVTSVTGAASAVPSTSYVVDTAAGTVRLTTRPVSGGPYVVSYMAGRLTVPAPLSLAARVILKAAWADRRGSSQRQPGGIEPNAGGITVSNDLVNALGIIPPKRALLMMGPYLRDRNGFA